ncbi:relaxase, partial [Akkermansia sp. BIOML-A63]
RVALKRGWTTAAEVRDTNIGQVNRDCMEILQAMESWSWLEYAARLRGKGYELWELQDGKNVLRGYVLKKGNARYKASELGRGRNLMASKLESTWKKLHAAPKIKTVLARPAAGTPSPTATRTTPVRAQGTVPLPQYTDYRPGTIPYRISDDRESRNYFIPDEALKVFDDEFDYRETANSRELTDRAVALFVGMMSAQAAPSGGGGGGSSDLPWGRREDEDDREWARRCAREAEKMIGKRPKTGRKR